MIHAGLEVSARLFTWYDKEFAGAFAGASHLEGVEAAKDAGVDTGAQVGVGVQAEKVSSICSIVCIISRYSLSLKWALRVVT